MLADQTLATIISRARRFGDKTAIICGDKRISFAELDGMVAALAAKLVENGLRPGEIVSLFAPSGWQWLIAYHAVNRSGAVVNPINPLLACDEVAFIIADCGPALLIADSIRLAALENAGAIPASLRRMDLSAQDFRNDGSGADMPVRPADPAGLSTICYTSGTTGRPKGAMLSHRSVLLNIALTAMMHGRSPSDVVVTSLPLAHVYGNVVANGALLSGATLVLVPAFSPEAVLRAIAEHRASCFDGVPTMYFRLLACPDADAFNIASLRQCTVGGQAMPVETILAVEARFGCPLIELWGMSEIAGLGTTFPWTGPKIPGSIGSPLPGMQVRVTDLVTGNAVPAGQAGELRIRGPLVMQGYLNNPAATRETVDEAGWLGTGDMARIDEDGHIFLLDRIKDVILTSGNNVYPAEIERVISEIPAVAMVGVGRAHHPDKGEVPVAFVVTRDNADLSADMVLAHCRSRLAPYKQPKAIHFVTDLPTTSSGKISEARTFEEAPSL